MSQAIKKTEGFECLDRPRDIATCGSVFFQKAVPADS